MTGVLAMNGGVTTTTLLSEGYFFTRWNMVMITRYSGTVHQAGLKLYITQEDAFFCSLYFVRTLAGTKYVRCCISRVHVRSLENVEKGRVADTAIRFK